MASLLVDPVCYSVNTTAMGDCLAAVPIVKYAIEKYHRECDYRVVASKHFREFFHFVPDAKFLVMEDSTWKFDKTYSVRRLNDVSEKGGNLCRLTPAKMSLSLYSAIGLVGELPNPDYFNYVPLKEVDVSRFGVDFSRAVILIVSYRDVNRSIPQEELIKIAAYVRDRGFIPVYVGRTEDGAWRERAPVSPFKAPDFGVDLRNMTTNPELASIMSKSIAVCGVDSGPIHLAGTTSTTIIAGYTNVHWKHRVPRRWAGRTIVIEPDGTVDCRYCSSIWVKDFYNFLNCYHGHLNCIKSLTAEKYINALSSVLENKSGEGLGFSEAWDAVKPTLLGEGKSRILHSEMHRVSNVKGDFAELGVFKGSTSKFIRLVHPGRNLHCYDTFQGIAKADASIDLHKDGEFAVSLDAVRSLVGTEKVEYHVGIFPESFKESHLKFAFVHVDLDTYFGTQTALDKFFPCLEIGGTILFDDYRWVACPGVEKAIKEWLVENQDKCTVREYTYQCAITKIA